MSRDVRLTVSSGPAAGASFVVRDGEEAVFGRSSGCGRHRLPLEDRRIARHQFVVRVGAGRARLWDLGGTNPTLVNGRPLPAAPAEAAPAGPPPARPPGASVELQAGDVVRVGQTTLLVSWSGGDPAPSPAPVPEGPGLPAVAAGNFPLGGLRFLASDGVPRVAGYTVVRRLGRGTGTTFLATRDGAPGRAPVVLKILRSQACLEDLPRLRLERSLTALCRFRHPGAVAVTDFGLESRSVPGSQTRLVLEMEWWDAPDARAFLESRGAGFSAFEIHALLRTAGGTLAAAHAAGLSHLGLKPGNLLVRPGADGLEVRLTDFRVPWIAACELPGWNSSEPYLAECRRFMSPRQRSQPESAGPGDDLWSLAALAEYLRRGGLESGARDPNRARRLGRPAPGEGASPGSPVEALDALLDRARAGEFPSMPEFLQAVEALPRPARLRIGG